MVAEQCLGPLMFPRFLRKCVLLALTCAVCVSALLYLKFHDYYGDRRLIPYGLYFIPSKTPQTFLGYEFLLNSDVCKSGGPFLFVMVMSMVHMKSQRDAIRATWGSIARTGQWPGVEGHFDVKLVFLFGLDDDMSKNRKLKEEAEKEGDIIQANFRESYDNLTLKVLMGFKWAEQNCPKTEFIMKADEDVFVNIPYFMLRLQALDWSKHILGAFFYSEFVMRDGKYRSEISSYRPPVYPPHVKGNMYVMKRDLAVRFYHTAPFMPYMRMEDVYITGVLAKIHGIRHVNIPEVTYDRYVPAKYCQLVKKVKVMSQKYTPEMFRKVWNMTQNMNEC